MNTDQPTTPGAAQEPSPMFERLMNPGSASADPAAPPADPAAPPANPAAPPADPAAPPADPAAPPADPAAPPADPAAPPADPAAPLSAFDWKNLGLPGVSNEAEWMAADVPGQLQKFRDAQQQLSAYQERFKQVTNPFANDAIGEYNQFLKEGGELSMSQFASLKAMDAANMSEIDALVNQAILETPSLQGRQNELRASFERKYGVNADKWKAEAEENGRTYTPQSDSLALTVDASRARRSIQEQQSKIKPFTAEQFDPAAINAQTQEAQAQVRQSWTPVVDKLMELPAVNIGGAEIPMDPQFAKNLHASVVNYAVNQNLAVNPEGLQQLNDFVVNAYLIGNRDHVLQTLKSQWQTEAKKQQDAVDNNAPPVDPNNPTPPPTPGQETTFQRLMRIGDQLQKGQ